MVLNRPLQLKLGLFDDAVQERIEKADSETLLRWADRVLTADNLSDVFGDD